MERYRRLIHQGFVACLPRPPVVAVQLYQPSLGHRHRRSNRVKDSKCRVRNPPESKKAHIWVRDDAQTSAAVDDDTMTSVGAGLHIQLHTVTSTKARSM